MISKRIKGKGVLNKLLEQGIRILLRKECKKISNLKININSNSIQIIKGDIQKIHISAEDINYKDLLFDEVKLEVSCLKINFNLAHKKLYFKNNPVIKFKISLSQNSLRKVLLSDNWNWIGNLISKEILNREKLKDIKIKNGKFFIKANESFNEGDQINIKTEEGKIYLQNKVCDKTIQIPIEDKIYIQKINIENNLINIFASSSITF